MDKEIECLVTGRVQRVMYRDFVQRQAKQLGIKGVVYNNRGKSVTVVAQGTEQILTIFIKLLNQGPLFSKVENVGITWRQPTNTYTNFKIYYRNLFDRI